MVGLLLRLYRLDAASMSLDEGFTWAAAAQPVNHLLQLQPLLDSGKLAVYDLLVHYWIEIFGDSLRSMRGLSSAIDTISILLMYAVVRELYQVFADGELHTGELAGGFAALIFATNVAVVQSARMARMYPLMTAAELAQILFFVRAQRRGGVLNCILTTVFLALAIAVNFTAAFILVSEAFWLAYLLIARQKDLPGADLRVAGPALALIGGLGLLLPWISSATTLARGATRYRDFGWIAYRPPIHWSYEVLRGNAGNKSLFRLFLALAAFGIWRHRNKAPLAPMFMAAAIVGPFAAVAVASLFGIRMMVDRYVLIAVIAFLGLAAIGAASFESKLGQVLVFVLIVRLSVQALRHSSAFWVDWKKAVAMACAESPVNAEIGVVPGYAVDVVRYHLPPQRRPFAVGLDSQCGHPQILIVNPGRFIPPAYMSELNACYPRLIGRATRVEVRSR
ncbi:MAG: glycosyltransferase family 39 protein [Deltaproteobacteria bacterium]|nr:glycosyltransferase family 39 protein [Deltaproteobacteria bacterium]MBV8451759.1 glycosyltransferase family 39 protein [Deltaproteobacteria bacterium]